MRRRDFIAGLLIAATIRRAQAQQRDGVYRIVVVSGYAPAEIKPAQRELFSELRRLGYVEGDNLVVERYSSQGRGENFDDLAREVVGTNPDLIIAGSARLALAFKAATTRIPLVVSMPDPVAYGVVSNLARPGGNITGFSIDAGLEIWSKRLALMKEVLPNTPRVALLASEAVWQSPPIAVLREAAENAKLTLIGPSLVAPFNENEHRHVFEAFRQNGADAVIVSDQPDFVTYGRIIFELARKARLPVISPRREYAALGALITYAWEQSELYKRLAREIAQILGGAKPGDIPFYQAREFNLIINLKTAAALGLTIPPSLLARADEVIE